MSEAANLRLYAQPYNLDASGFDFDSPEDFERLTTQCRDRYGSPVEEYEILFLDGSDEDAELWRALSPTQMELTRWFDDVKPHEKAALFALVDSCGYLLPDALDVLDDAVVYEGDTEEYVDGLMDDSGLLDEMPEHLRFYFDTSAYTRDLRFNGDLTEFSFAGGDRVIERI